MRLVVDTNLLISALLVEGSAPAGLLAAWRHGRFTLLTAELQLEELRRVTRYPKVRKRLRPALAGELVNQLRDLAVLVDKLPAVDISPDPFDNFLLAIAQAGQADYLISGDRRGLLDIGRFSACKILTLSDFLEQLR